jgi:N-acetylmuramoyl-L-alanine amidase
VVLLPCEAISQPVKNFRTFTVILDSGHNPMKGGTRSTRGIKEVNYNDQLVALLKKELLSIDQIQVILTREPEEHLELNERAVMANKHKADLFISIHHDSAQLKYLEKLDVSGELGYSTENQIQGYSLFVSRQNKTFEGSLKFARILGKELRKINRVPSHHHAENIKGENRILLFPDLGIYLYDELVVLKKTFMPAILFEAGVIVDASDESYISDPENKRIIAKSIKKALIEFFNL